MGEFTTMLSKTSIGFLVLAAACGGSPKTGEAPLSSEVEEPTATRAKVIKPLSDGSAIFISGDELVSVIPGQEPQVLVNVDVPENSAAAWCAVDNRAQVIWFSDDSGLNAFDLVDHRTRVIIDSLDEGIGDVRISHGDAGQLGSTSDMDGNVRLAVFLNDGPVHIASEDACDGDAAWSCYTDINDGPPEEWPLNAELASHKKYLQSLVIQELKYMQGLVTRSEGKSLFANELKGTPLPRLKIVKEKYCVEEPDECGLVHRITEHIWRVVVYNDRGDFFHQSEQLYDSRTKEFLDIVAGTRSLTPTQENTKGIENLFVSPSGTHALFLDSLFSLDDDSVTKAANGFACGFVGGGTHVGPLF